MRILSIIWLVATLGAMLFVLLFAETIIENTKDNFNVVMEYDYYDKTTGETYDLTYGMHYISLSIDSILFYLIGLVLGIIGSFIFYRGKPQEIFRVWFYIGGVEVGNYENTSGIGMILGAILILGSWILKLSPLYFIITTLIN